MGHPAATEAGYKYKTWFKGLALLARVSDTCCQRVYSRWEYLQTTIARQRQNLAPLPLPT